MPDTLLDIVQVRFGIQVDPDSDGGRILGSLTPQPPLSANGLAGNAVATALSIMPTAKGVSVRAAQGGDLVTLSLPDGPLAFAIVPPGGGQPEPQLEVTLLSPTLSLPFLRPATATPDGLLQEAVGEAELQLPDLLLVVTIRPQAKARLAPAQAGGELVATMNPPLALLGPGTVLGLGFVQAALKLDGPEAPLVTASDVELLINPPGIPALASRGAANDLRIGLGPGGGVSGDFSLVLDQGAGAAVRPEFLQALTGRVRLSHSRVTLLEIDGEVDLQTAVEERLGGALAGPPAAGVLAYTLSLALDGGWQATLELRAAGGQGYLWRTQSANGSPLSDTLGAYAVFAPLLASTIPGAGESGYADLALGGGVAAGMAAAGLVHTRSVTLFGGELVVHQPPAGSAEAFLLLDVETELDITASVGGTELLATKRPLKVRHQAMGLRLDFGPGGDTLRPIFDPGQGFGLDLSDPGMFRVPAPLGDIIQPQGARMARENPLNIEVDLAMTADLGVVTVDRASVRVPIETTPPLAVGTPSLTGLGVHVDIPGALSGGGALQLLPDGIFGSLDVSLAPPINTRVAAQVRVEHVTEGNDSGTAVAVSLGVILPVPIPLANSGLGILGFDGLFAMHYRRNQGQNETALEWFETTARGNAADLDPNLNAWVPKLHQWALGLGAVLGTVEGGFLMNAKGMVVLELPGPRVLLAMKASLLSAPPSVKEPSSGNYLAVIEITKKSLIIGLVVDYNMLKPLLEIRIPVEASFDFEQMENWHLDIGRFDAPATVKYLFTLRGEGYLMLHGNGIPDEGTQFNADQFPVGPLHGFSVAAGVRAALTWGSEDIGLYLKVAAQADVGISFKPLVVIGKMAIRGELHLFIVGIEASAAADVILTPNSYYVFAEVCGKVEFLFFDVEGCVTLKLGEEPKELPKAEPLVRALSLHSRSPALLPGSAGDRPVDGSLGDAARFEDNQWQGEMPVVPIDAIPVIQLEMRPALDSNLTILGLGRSDLKPALPEKLPVGVWVRRGQRYYRYTLKSVSLRRVGANDQTLEPAVEDGETPAVWWDRLARPAGSQDNEVQLALLNWIPNPTPAATIRTEELDKRVEKRWGQVCLPAAPPAGVLWSFRSLPPGESAQGWSVTGTAWPDPAGTWRSSTAATWLKVNEPWRSGILLADNVAAVDPAVVLAANGTSGRVLVGPHTGLEILPRVDGDANFKELFAFLRTKPLDTLADALRLAMGGMNFIRLLLFINPEVFEPGIMLLRSMDAAGATTGLEMPIGPNTARLVGGLNDLPPEWLDPAGPWRQMVTEAFQAWSSPIAGLLREPRLVLVEAELMPGSTQVEVSVPEDIGLPGRYWGVVLVEALAESEAVRFTFDEQYRRDMIQVIDGALGHDEGQRALLQKDATYEVEVTYDVILAEVGKNGDPEPQKNEDGSDYVESLSQRFRFRTDSQPPKKLDSWVLATDPAPYQQGFFWGDALRVVFATPATRRMFKAYGRELHARVRAASNKHPGAAPGFDPGHLNLSDTAQLAQRVPAVAMTPWESATRAALQAAKASCVTFTKTDLDGDLVTLTLQLEPLTDYILDIEAGANGQLGSYPLFRRHFTTSRYRNMGEMAAAVQAAAGAGRLGHRRLANPAPLAQLGAAEAGKLAVVTDIRLEEALRAAEWGDLARPKEPRVTVIWQDGQGGNPPQPVAVLLETTEPLWRWRDVPKELTDAFGHKRFVPEQAAWLAVVEAGGPFTAGFITSPGGGRSLALLAVNARGATLNLSLNRIHHPMFEGNSNTDTVALAAVSLLRAPWEEE